MAMKQEVKVSAFTFYQKIINTYNQLIKHFKPQQKLADLLKFS